MPAASADKRARQRANKLSQKEPTPSAPAPPAATVKFTSLPPLPFTAAPPFSTATENATPTPWPAPSPATFTISYIPLSISYPEPENPAAKLPTDAVRVTRSDLALLLRQSYNHGTEHGWKANVAVVREHLQADYDKDMEDVTAKFEIHEKQIRDEEFKRGFDSGRDTALRLESERQESIRTLRADCSIQTESPEPKRPLHIDLSTQTELLSPKITLPIPLPEPPATLPLPHSLSKPVSNFLSSLFEPFESTALPIFDQPISTVNPEPPPTLSPPFIWSEEPSDVPNLLPLSPPPPLVPTLSTSYPSRDFSDLHSGANPWQSLQYRKGRDRRRSAQPIRQREHQRPTFTTKLYPNSRHLHIPHIMYPIMPYEPPPKPPAPLDWHADPRLFELSQVLKTLGWVPPSTARP